MRRVAKEQIETWEDNMLIARRKSGILPTLVGAVSMAGLAIAGLTPSTAARADDALIHYNGNTRDYWEHPPADWYMGDENAAQHGERPYPGQPTPTAHDELVNLVKENIKLQPGFHIEVLASGIDCPRQMVFGDDGTLYVGCWTDHVFALKKQGGAWTSKIIIKGLRMPTGIGFHNGSLYVADIDKIYKYADIAKNIDNPKGEVVYSDFPPYTSHGWKYMVADTERPGWFYIPVGPPCSECLPPSGTAQYRHINPDQGLSEVVALGQRNSVGGDVDPRSGQLWFSENARDWMGDNLPSDKLNHLAKWGLHFGYPYCHQGDLPDPTYNMGHKCDEFTPPALNVGAHMAPLGMKFYSGNNFPAEYHDNIFLAEHGGWNQRIHTGARIMRIQTDVNGEHVTQEPFAWGWIKDNKYWGRPADIAISPEDGSMLVADDQAGAIYRIWYDGK
jgi:glucose/arabinose dehydrogenase